MQFRRASPSIVEAAGENSINEAYSHDQIGTLSGGVYKSLKLTTLILIVMLPPLLYMMNKIVHNSNKNISGYIAVQNQNSLHLNENIILSTNNGSILNQTLPAPAQPVKQPSALPSINPSYNPTFKPSSMNPTFKPSPIPSAATTTLSPTPLPTDDTPQGSRNQFKFLDQLFTYEEWEAKNVHINDLLGNGAWVESWKFENYKVPYSEPCVDIIKYKWGKCIDSPVNQGKRYLWKPSRSSSSSSSSRGGGGGGGIGDVLSPWSSQTMCSMVNGRNVLVAGDSLSEEFFFSLLSHLLASVEVSTASTNYSSGSSSSSSSSSSSNYDAMIAKIRQQCLHFCHDWYPSCTGPVEISCGPLLPSFKLGFARTDSLSLGDYEWQGQISIQNASLLILNTGAHYNEMHEELSQLDKMFEYLREKFPHVSVIYRTTIAGHENCDALFNQPPLAAIPKNEHIDPNYHWNDVRNRSLLFQELIKAKYPGILIVDVFNATSLRGDSHVGGVDCLHYCLPGVPDDWVLFMYNALLQLFPNISSNSMLDGSSTKTIEVVDRSIVSKWEGKIFGLPGSSTAYKVLNGTRHVFLNGTNETPVKINQKLINELYAIPIGRPI